MLSRFVLALIRLYQAIKKPFHGLLPPVCRFYPSCSHYAHDAIERFGPWRGGGLMIKRLVRCHPYNPGGLDPVPTE